jgi:hypothetical protein
MIDKENKKPKTPDEKAEHVKELRRLRNKRYYEKVKTEKEDMYQKRVEHEKFKYNSLDPYSKKQMNKEKYLKRKEKKNIEKNEKNEKNEQK